MSIEAKRNAKIEITSSAAGVDKGVNDARRKLRKMQREEEQAKKDAERKDENRKKRLAKGSLGFVKSSALGAAAGLGLGLGVAGGVGSLVGEFFDVEKALTRFQINGEVAADKMEAFRAELMRVSNATGVSRKNLLEGASAYVAVTGDAAGAQESLQLFGEVANATGASMSDIANTAAAMRQNLKIDPKNFREAFDVLITQGHAGAVELSDLATQLANVAPAFSQFAGGASAQGLAELGASMQVARQAFGNADQTATGFRDLMTEIVRYSAQLEDSGVKVFKTNPKTGKKELRGFLEIIDQINNKIQNPDDLIAVLGEAKAVQAVQKLGSERKQLQDLIDKSMGSNATARDNTKFMESSAGKLQRAWETIKNSIAEALTPDKVQAFADAMLSVAAAITQIIQGIDALLSHTDTAGSIGKLGGQQLVDAAQGLSPAQKLARADQLTQQALKTDVPTNVIDEGKLQAKLNAAKELRRQGDVWNQGGSVGGGIDYNALGNAVVNGFRRAGITFNISANEVSTALGSSIKQHKRPGGERP